MRAHRKKEKEEEERKGFDAIEASFLEKGLIAAGSGRSMGSKAIGDTHARHESHHTEREKTHRTEFVTRENRQSFTKRAEFIVTIHRKTRPKHTLAPPQMKKRDVDDPNKKKKR